MVLKVILISLVGSLLCLDRVFMQTMVCRPVIIAPVIGFILGNPYAGLIIGAMLELFWMERIPIGIYIPPNDSVTAAFAVSLAVLAGGSHGAAGHAMIALAVLIAIPFGIAVKQIDVKIMRANDRLSDQAIEDAKALNVRAIERKIRFSLVRVWLLYLAVLFVLQIIFIPAVSLLYPMLPGAVHNALSMTFYFLLLLGVAVALSTVKLRGSVPVFLRL